MPWRQPEVSSSVELLRIALLLSSGRREKFLETASSTRKTGNQMSISLNGQTLNESRIARIMDASSLDDAQRMGLFDRIKDFFRGGVKKEAIRQVFDMLKPVKENGLASLDKHGQQLGHFAMLRAATQAPHASRYELDVAVNEARGTWSYSMNIEGISVVQGRDLPIENGYTLTAFQDHKLLATLCNHLQESRDVDPQNVFDTLQDRFSEINNQHSQSATLRHPSTSLTKFSMLADTLLKQFPEAYADIHTLTPGVEVQVGTRHCQAILKVGTLKLASFPATDRTSLRDMLILDQKLRLQHTTAMNQRDEQTKIENAVQDMVDDVDRRGHVLGILKDPTYSSGNFKEILDPDGNPVFTARFVDQKGEEYLLDLSNRGASNGELRAQRLQEKLATGQYANLADLIGQDLGTENDAMVIYPLNGARQELKSIAMYLEGAPGDSVGLTGEDDVAEFMKEIQRELSPMSVCKTTYGAVATRCEWEWEHPAPEDIILAAHSDSSEPPPAYA
jgi:hypothetical protein